MGRTPISAKIKTSAVENVPESDLWAGDWTPKTGPCGLNLALMGRAPWSARVPLDPHLGSDPITSRPTWASAADQGVRPTLHSSIRAGSGADLIQLARAMVVIPGVIGLVLARFHISHPFVVRAVPVDGQF